MIEKPFFSIIIPVFNTEKDLPRAIDSVLTQNFSNFEIIVVNDCSPGNCIEIINVYNDNRIKLIDKKQNEGTHMARKSGVELANSEYCLFLDSDDCFAVNCLELLYTYLKENPVDLLEFGFNTQGTKMVDCFNYLKEKKSYFDQMLKNNTKFKNHCIANKALKTDVVKKSFKKMKNFHCVWFEDGYEYFILTTQCKTFDAIEEYLYLYNMPGITQNSKNGLTYVQFEIRVNNIADIYRNLLLYLEEENLLKYMPVLHEVYVQQVTFLMSTYFPQIKNEEKVKGLQLALEKIKKEEMVNYINELIQRPSTKTRFYKIYKKYQTIKSKITGKK